jgi:hypothetical protein
MATNLNTIKAMARLADKLDELGVVSKDFTTFKQHIGQQSREIAWYQDRDGNWKYGKQKGRK